MSLTRVLLDLCRSAGAATGALVRMKAGGDGAEASARLRDVSTGAGPEVTLGDTGLAINTPAAAGPLHIVNDGLLARFGRNLSGQHADLSNMISGVLFRSFSDPANAKLVIIDCTTDGANTTPSAGANGIDLQVRGATALRVMNDGDVWVVNKLGVGADPQVQLHVKASTDILARLERASAADNIIFQLRTTASAATGYHSFDFGDGDDFDVGQVRYDHASDTLHLKVAGADRVGVDADGLAVTGDITASAAAKVGTYTVATVPSAATKEAGAVIYVSDGAAGSPILAFSDGTGWRRLDTGAVIGTTADPIEFPLGGELTIAAGAITVSRAMHAVDTEGDAASDDLDTIHGGSDGHVLVLRAASSARTVVCRNTIGNLRLSGDFPLDNSLDRLVLVHDTGNWYELSRSGNGA